jgi:ribosomal protein L17
VCSVYQPYPVIVQPCPQTFELCKLKQKESLVRDATVNMLIHVEVAKTTKSQIHEAERILLPLVTAALKT